MITRKNKNNKNEIRIKPFIDEKIYDDVFYKDLINLQIDMYNDSRYFFPYVTKKRTRFRSECCRVETSQKIVDRKMTRYWIQNFDLPYGQTMTKRAMSIDINTNIQALFIIRHIEIEITVHIK